MGFEAKGNLSPALLQLQCDRTRLQHVQHMSMSRSSQTLASMSSDTTIKIEQISCPLAPDNATACTNDIPAPMRETATQRDYRGGAMNGRHRAHAHDMDLLKNGDGAASGGKCDAVHSPQRRCTVAGKTQNEEGRTPTRKGNSSRRPSVTKDEFAPTVVISCERSWSQETLCHSLPLGVVRSKGSNTRSIDAFSNSSTIDSQD